MQPNQPDQPNSNQPNRPDPEQPASVTEPQPPTEQTIVSDAAQSANQVLSTVAPEATLPVTEPLPETAQNIVTVPAFMTAPVVSPEVGPTMQSATPVTGGVVGSALVSKGKKKLWIPIILAVLTLMLVVGGIVFYFAYWTSSDVVYQRFQKNIAKVVDKTGDAEIDLINDYTYKINVSSEIGEKSFSADSDGRAVESGFSTLSDFTYNGASLSIEGRLLNEINESPYQLFFKLKGVNEMLDTMYTEEESFVDAAKVDKYEDKWIFVDLTSFLDSSDQGEKAKALNKVQYKELWSVFSPIVKSRLVGLGEDNDVYTTSNPRSEKVAGKSTWAYDITYSKLAYNEMMDELIKVVDTTSLDTAQKDLLVKTLKEGKNYIPEDENKSTSSYESKYRQDEKVTIWIEKNSGVIMQFMTTSESFYDNISESKSTTTASITDISPELIKGSISYSDTSKYNSSDGKINLVLDNNIRTLTADGEFASKNPDNDKEEYSYKFTVKVEPNTDNTPIEPPTGAIDLEQVTQDLFGQTF